MAGTLTQKRVSSDLYLEFESIWLWIHCTAVL